MVVELEFRTLLNGETFGTGSFSYEGSYAVGTVIHKENLISFSYEDSIVGKFDLSHLTNFDFVYAESESDCAFNVLASTLYRTRSLTAGPAKPNTRKLSTSANTSRPFSQSVELEWPAPKPATETTETQEITQVTTGNSPMSTNVSAGQQWPFPLGNIEDLVKLLNWLHFQGQREFGYSYLNEANLTYAKLPEINLSFSYLYKSNLLGANFVAANLGHSYLGYAYLGYVNLSYAYLGYSYLAYADFSYADLSFADFSYADLSNVNFTGANLTNAKLTGANLIGTNFTNANVTNTIFS